MSGSKNSDLISILDDLFESLREEARPSNMEADGQAGDGPKIGFVDRLKLMEVGSRWVQIRNRIEPNDESDPFTEARQKLVGGTRRRGSATAPHRSNGAA